MFVGADSSGADSTGADSTGAVARLHPTATPLTALCPLHEGVRYGEMASCKLCVINALCHDYYQLVWLNTHTKASVPLTIFTTTPDHLLVAKMPLTTDCVFVCQLKSQLVTLVCVCYLYLLDRELSVSFYHLFYFAYFAYLACVVVVVVILRLPCCYCAHHCQ